MNDDRLEKRWLIALAALSLIILGAIGIGAMRSSKIDGVSAGIIGAIVTGLVAFPTAVVQALRGFSMGRIQEKLTDQLAAKPAIADPTGAAPIGTPDDPVSVVDATDRIT